VTVVFRCSYTPSSGSVFLFASHHCFTSQRDDELILIEKRNFFSLFCLDLEAQLIHVNLAQLPEMFEYLTAAQIKGHTEYQSAWEEVKTVVNGMAGGGARLSLTSPTPEHPLSALLTDSSGSNAHATISPFV